MSKPQRQQNQAILGYVRQYKETQDEDAFQEIAAALHSYLRHLAIDKFYYVAGSNSDDIYEQGLIALAIKAIPDYKEEKGPFISFAKLCIKRHIITVLKNANNGKNGPLNGAKSIDATVCNDEDGSPVSIKNFLPNGDEGVVDSLIQREAFFELKKLLKGKLTMLESTVLDLYLNNLSYVEISIFMNKTRRGKNRVDAKVVDNALCRIKKKAMEIIEECDDFMLDP